MYEDPYRWPKLFEAADFFVSFLDSTIPLKAVENPIIHKFAARLIGKRQTQVIQPWMFGEPESKATCLWLEGLPPLEETNNVKHLVEKKGHKVHRMGPSPERSNERSRTPKGLAKAMASQWSSHFKE